MLFVETIQALKFVKFNIPNISQFTAGSSRIARGQRGSGK